jgi:hypothetical protein
MTFCRRIRIVLTELLSGLPLTTCLLSDSIQMTGKSKIKKILMKMIQLMIVNKKDKQINKSRGRTLQILSMGT